MTRTFIALPLAICLFVLTSAQVTNDDHLVELRRYNKLDYTVLDSDGITIYSRTTHIAGNKARETQTRYYFSKSMKSEIMPLTIDNLKHAYSRNRDFHNLLDVHFRSNKELSRYDTFYKEYKLKSVFRQAFD